MSHKRAAATQRKKSLGELDVVSFLRSLGEEEQDDSKTKESEEAIQDETTPKAAVKTRTKKQKSDVEEEQDMDEHRRELEQLKETDPEFYEHLRKEATDLLRFGEEVHDQDAEHEEREEEDVDDDGDETKR